MGCGGRTSTRAIRCSGRAGEERRYEGAAKAESICGIGLDYGLGLKAYFLLLTAALG